jgi:hypothetical protein
MRYINVRQVHQLIGSNYPKGAARFAESLDEYLVHLAKSGERLPEAMLAHNLSPKRDRSRCDLARLDADLLLEFDVTANKLNCCLKDYRANPEFARPAEEQRVVVHVWIVYPDRTQWAIHVPLQALMRGFGDPEQDYQGYAHTIALLDADGHVTTEYKYCGITGRNWLERMGEHFREMRAGSNKAFHRAWREFQGRKDLLLNSELIVLNQTYEAAMAWEEWIVDRHKAEGVSLNMIAGGFKGQKELHKFGLLREGATLKERDEALLEYSTRHRRAGIPNLLVAGLWEDDAYYERVIQGRSNTLTKDQVLRIRYLASIGWNADKICSEIGARTVEQVRGVIGNKTYVRMQ